MLPVNILALSDTHFVDGDDFVIKEMESFVDEVDYIVHAGDYTCVSYVRFLEKTGKFVGVAGNMDVPGVKSLLPLERKLDLGDVSLGIIHGWGGPNGIIDRIHPTWKEKETDIVIFGHTHQAFSGEKDGIKYFNPGSPVDRRFARKNTFLLLTINSRDDVEARFVEIPR